MILPVLLPPVKIVVHPEQVLNRIAPAMYGACLEDVNHEVYGGLYDQRIFGESFAEPSPGTSPKGWRELGGEWTPSGAGAAHVRAADGPKLLREMDSWTDGTVEAQVRIANDFGENAGLLVRVSNAGVGADDFDGYEISLSAKTRTILLGKHLHDFRTLTSVPAPVVSGQWHRLRVKLSGPSIRVFLDNEPQPRIDYLDPDPLGAGSFAVRSWRADAEFREIRFNGARLSVSFAGPGVSRLWDRVLTGAARARFALEEGASNGQLCQRIQYLGGTGVVGVADRGLNRWGISIRAGRVMEGRVSVKGDVGSAWVSLQNANGTSVYTEQELTVGSSWAKRSFKLRPSTTDRSARFVLSIVRPGNLYVDRAVLMSAREVRFKGLPVRRDIAEALVASGVNFLRYGGSMVNAPGYRWKNMIGDPDRRPAYAGFWYPCSSNGFGIFEFLSFCEKAKVGSAFAINADEAPRDVADLADYLTAPVSNPWGKRRAMDGHPAPFHPDYIEIGNEEAIANPDPIAMKRYASKFRALANAIHERDPSLKLVCAAWWVPDAPQMKVVFDAVDGRAAAWDMHFWCDELAAGVGADRELDRAEKLFKLWNPKTTLKAVIFEENGNRHDMQRALGHALTVNASRRHGGFVLADCAANALQAWRQNDNGWDQGGVFYTPDKAWLMPPAVAQQVLSHDRLPLRVLASAEGGLDVLATRSEDGREVDLTVVNPTGASVSSSIDLGSFAVGKVIGWTCSGALSGVNSSSRGVVQKPLLVDPAASGARSTLGGHSISVIRFRVSRMPGSASATRGRAKPRLLGSQTFHLERTFTLIR
jgi:hypothetical protein